ncbi:Uncharacterized protein dnm_050910 [Desulfonema magnum]|uniref:Uncharacterized protein n=1 Tax=Desulfonema magnum TaxID=45655 RepID=A0A975BNN6_9BACT|nr:Uncharacterized protein dnm_050910 [Desulfonema magnum]
MLQPGVKPLPKYQMNLILEKISSSYYDFNLCFSNFASERLIYGKPLGGSAELVKFFLSVQINYEHFMPGRGLCNDPIQLLTISRSEGVKCLEKLPA